MKESVMLRMRRSDGQDDEQDKTIHDKTDWKPMTRL